MRSEQIRQIFFYGAILLFILSFGVIPILILLSIFGVNMDWGPVFVFGASIFGTLITLVLSSQKQAIEETTIIRQLFGEFNARYHAMNKKLNAIKDGQTLEELTEDEKNELYDYFNLCGEEYLYFKRGYIYTEVWRAWCKGMVDYLNNQRICKLWDEEEKKESYYGLTYAIIKSANGGAKTTN